MVFLGDRSLIYVITVGRLRIVVSIDGIRIVILVPMTEVVEILVDVITDPQETGWKGSQL